MAVKESTNQNQKSATPATKTASPSTVPTSAAKNPTPLLDNKNMQTEFINPKIESVGYNSNFNKLIWFVMKAKPVYKLTGNIRAQKAYADKMSPEQPHEEALAVTVKHGEEFTFKFLASPELIETITHDWQAYDSVGSSIAQAYAQFGISTLEQLRALHPSLREQPGYAGVAKGLSNLGKNVASSMKAATSLEQKVNVLVDNFANAATGGYVANYRVDTPLQYKGSERRSFELQFTLVNTESGKNAEEVVMPVKLLEMLSSPAYGSKPDAHFNADIIIPYVFEVNTTPGDLITCDMAVLKQVQPTWKGPWIDGYPSRCELRLQFYEYRPLEQSVFYGTNTTNTKISTTMKNRVISYENMDLKTSGQNNQKPGDKPMPPEVPKVNKQKGAYSVTLNKDGSVTQYNPDGSVEIIHPPK